MEASKKPVEQHPFTLLWSVKSVRLQMALLLMLAFLVLSLMRGNLGMALMCMVERNDTTMDSTSIPADHNTALQVHWTTVDISIMHMGFYAGIFVCTFVAQNYALRFGPKAVITAGLIVNVLCTWAVPLAALWVPHFASVAALRFGMGLSQGFFIPCASMLIAKWFPEDEKSLAMAIFTTGNQLGIAVAMYSTAELCKLPVLAGWPTSFFIYGLLGTLFLALWQPLANNKPREAKRITIEELAYIDGIGTRRRAPTLVQKTPYKKLLFSPAVLATCVSSFSQCFVFVAMISYLPEFYRSVLGLNLSLNGIWSALPFLVQMVSKLAITFLANSIRSWGHFSHQFITKFFNLLATVGCAGCLLAVSLTSNPTLMLAFLCGSFAFISGYVPGYNTSIVCVAPAYTAAVSAYGQAWAQVASIVAPIAIGLITEEPTNEYAWSIVFQMLVAIVLASGVIFQFFGSVNVQPWAATAVSANARRIQRISEANEELRKTEEENGQKVKSELKLDFATLEDDEGTKNKDGENGESANLDIPRMHHRLSVLDSY